jgi:hypothetical protein
MAEGEAEEDDAALGDPVLAEVNSGIVPSAEEVVSGAVGSVRAGSPEWRGSGASSSLSAVTNAHPATAETNALASALAQVSPYTNTRRHRGVPSWSRSGRNTANAPSSTANATKSVTPTAEVGISIIRPTSYAMAALQCSDHQRAPPDPSDSLFGRGSGRGLLLGRASEKTAYEYFIASSTQLPLIGQPVEKLPLCPLRPQIGPQTHRIGGSLELLEPDL